MSHAFHFMTRIYKYSLLLSMVLLFFRNRIMKENHIYLFVLLAFISFNRQFICLQVITSISVKKSQNYWIFHFARISPSFCKYYILKKSGELVIGRRMVQ